MSQVQFFTYSGAHFKTCPVVLREAWASVGSYVRIKEFVEKYTCEQNVEFVIISTCNRYDICFFGSISKQVVFSIYYDLLKDYINQNKLVSKELFFPIEKLNDFLHIYFNADAIRALYKVTASLDSLVLGESQILGQVKDAYFKAVELGCAQNQAIGIFSRNFRVAKRIRTETEIGKNGISIGNAALEAILRVFDTVENKKIVIFGAGEMARITAQHLINSRAKGVFIANRTYERAEKLSFELREAWPLQLSDALSRIYEFDICITAVSGSHYILSKEHLKKYNKKRNGKLSVMVDISVPRKIDPSLSEIDDLFLFNVDDLDGIMEANRKLRQNASMAAEKIIDEEIHEYLVMCQQKQSLAYVGKFHSWIKSVSEYELNRFAKSLQNGKKTDAKVVSEAIAKKIVSHVAQLARNDVKPINDENSVGDLLDFLFKLSEQPLLPENFKKGHNVLKLPIKSSKKINES